MNRRTRRLAKLSFFFLVFIVAVISTSLCYYEFAPPEKTCLSCHEIRESYDRWAASAHREVPCKSCHGGTLSSGLHGLSRSLSRAFAHWTAEDHGRIRLHEEQVVAMNENCRSCHRDEYADWVKGAHDVTYAEMFLDEDHNRKNLLTEDCLRCHGMFYAGEIADLVTPLDTEGPWRFQDEDARGRPAIPCLACHRIHAPESADDSAAETEEGDVASSASKESIPVSIQLYSRSERSHIAAVHLPVPRILAKGREVLVSPDPRQRLCQQCHAPRATLESRSADDRTPTGVHEGLSCVSCHRPHSGETRTSCSNCHPRFSHCGLDVTRMDTTFLSTGSRHDIHFVDCEDCHPGGRPADADR